MSARILNLLAEPKTESSKISKPSASVPPIGEEGDSKAEGPAPPPGLEKFGPPTPTTAQTGGPPAKEPSETVEDACLSSSGSTRFEEDGDVEPGMWHSQDWEISAWGQPFAYPTYPSMPEAAPSPFPVPSEGAILSTTPLHPPTLSSTPPSAAWEWPAPHMPEAEMMASHGCYPEHGLPEPHLMNPMPPMPMPPIHGVHYPMPDTTFLSYGSYGHPPVGPELQSPAITNGSFGHETGNCKPCAFVYTKGCQSGAQCAFCHLCPPGEKDRRKKVKHIMARIRRKSSKADGTDEE